MGWVGACQDVELILSVIAEPPFAFQYIDGLRERLEGDAPPVIIGLSVLLNKDYGLRKSQLRYMLAK